MFACFDNKVTDDFIGVEALSFGGPVILWFVELYLEGAAGDGIYPCRHRVSLVAADNVAKDQRR